MSDKRIIQLDERTTLASGDYAMLDNATDGSHKYDMKALGDRVAASETALGGHTVGKSVPSDAVFTDTVYSLPTMSASTKGGAKLGSGLSASDDALSVAAGGIGSTELADGAVTTPKLADDAVTMPKLADDVTGGAFPDITSGLAEALESTEAQTSTFLAGHATPRDGVAKIERLLGNTVVWNQQAHIDDRPQYYTLEDGVITITADVTNTIRISPQNSIRHVSGHKYIFIGQIIENPNDVSFTFGVSSGFPWVPAQSTGVYYNPAPNQIYTSNYDNQTLQLHSPSGNLKGVKITAMEIDLTRIFGAGNEPSTVAEFEAMFPESYYLYDAGSLLSVNVEGVESVGFNQFDGVVELGGINTSGNNTTTAGYYRSKNYTPVIGGQDYYFNVPVAMNVMWYDENKAFISWEGVYSPSYLIKTAPHNARYVRFRNAYENGWKPDTQGPVCINLSDPTRNGEYQPYMHDSRAIPLSTYFPNGLRGIGNTHDELTNEAAITRIGSRAYTSGDESDSSVKTDGTTTQYVLTTPTTTTINPPLNLSYHVEQSGTESFAVDEEQTAPQSAPPIADIAYGYTAEGLRDAALSTVANVENGKASTNYAVGSYLIRSGKLYRVTTAIASGESITPGTNCTQVTVMSEIVRLTS